MTDIATRWDRDRSFGDWSIMPANAVSWTDENGNSVVDENGQPLDTSFTAGGVLAAGEDLFTAALISIFTDAAAGPDDKLPVGEEDDPRGWWAGAIGSKIWLRLRLRADDLTRAMIENDMGVALQWMLDDGVVTKIEISTEWARPGALSARILFHRTDGTRRAMSFTELWDNL